MTLKSSKITESMAISLLFFYLWSHITVIHIQYGRHCQAQWWGTMERISQHGSLDAAVTTRCTVLCANDSVYFSKNLDGLKLCCRYWMTVSAFFIWYCPFIPVFLSPLTYRFCLAVLFYIYIILIHHSF